MKNPDRAIVAFCILALLLMVVIFPIVVNVSEEEKPAGDGLLAATTEYMSRQQTTLISAAALHSNLYDDYTPNDPFILSIRSPEQYARGHIPGALNIPYEQVFTEENLARLPGNRQIVVYSDTGHRSAEVAGLLGLYGFEAASLLWGMSSWTSDKGLAPEYFVPGDDGHDYPLSTVPSHLTSTRQGCGFLTEDDIPLAVDDTFVEDAAAGYLTDTQGQRRIDASELYGLLLNADPAELPVLIDLRSPTQYTAGHIEGSVNINYTSLLDTEVLDGLSMEAGIVLLCDLGHTASMATALLCINGYEAKALKWGMASWTANRTSAPVSYIRAKDAHNFPVHLGTDSGDVVTAAISDLPEVVRQAAEEYMNSGRNTYVSAAGLYGNLLDGYEGNDPILVDIRSPGQYSAGHIPGALNIPFEVLFTPTNLSKLSFGRDITVYGATGHLESQAAAILNVLGYRASALKWGMSSWTLNTTAAPDYFDGSKVNDHSFSCGDYPGSWGRSTRQGCLEGFTDISSSLMEDSRYDVIRPIGESYSAGGYSDTITEKELYSILENGNTLDDPYMIDIREASLYAEGHITGAVRIDYRDMFSKDNVEGLPRDGGIVVVCSVGRSGSQVAALLGLMGYNASALEFGMSSWTTNTTVAPWRYERSIDCRDYPFVTGPDPGDFPDGDLVTIGDLIFEATLDFVNSGTNTLMTSEALYTNLLDNYPGNDPFILSIRTPAQYLAGHIPGAVNIPYPSLFTKENMTLLPINRQIVVYGNSSHEACQVSSLLSVMGYDAVYLNWGMCSWTTNSDHLGGCYDRPTDSNDHPIKTGPFPGTLGGTRSENPAPGTRQGCGGDIDAFLVSAPTEPVGEEVRKVSYGRMEKGVDELIIKADKLQSILASPGSGSKPYIIDLRLPEDYAAGHITTAVNQDSRDMFNNNMELLPKNRQIIVVCYLGNQASRVAALLGINGYDAAALEWGMSSWTRDVSAAPSYYDPLLYAKNYPVFTGEEPGDIFSVLIDPTDVILSSTRDLLVSGKQTFITAEALYANLADGFENNDPYILSVQSEDAYREGHVPTAVHMPYSSVFTRDNLSLLPINKQIVVHCTSGHSSAQTAALLRLLGYDAVNLKWGMSVWTTNTTAAPDFFDEETDSNEYPFIIGKNPGNMPKGTRSSGSTRQCGDNEVEGTGGVSIDWSSADTRRGILREISDAYASLALPVVTTADSLYAKLTDANSSNDPFLLDVREPVYYEAGHVPASVNIEFSGLFEESNLSSLPDNRKIVVICYLGQTANEAAALLNINGYDAVALKWGITSWTRNTTVAPWRYHYGWDTYNYPVAKGLKPRTLESSKVLGKTAGQLVLEASSKVLSEELRMFCAPDISLNLMDINESNNPFVIDIRSPSEYSAGHIPTALNFPWQGIFTIQNMSAIPDDGTQVVVYDGHGEFAGQITSILIALGYNAYSLKYGMTSWTTNATAAPGAFNKTLHQKSYPFETGSRFGTRTGTRDLCGEESGDYNFTGTTFDRELVRRAAEALMLNLDSQAITAEAVYNMLYDNYTPNDPFIIDVRIPGNFAYGHLPGALNIEPDMIFSNSSLGILPKDRLIVVYCIAGHRSGHIASLLNLNGYDAISLDRGLCSWTGNETAVGFNCYDPDLDCLEYPVCFGTTPGDWGSAVYVS